MFKTIDVLSKRVTVLSDSSKNKGFPYIIDGKLHL